MFKFLAWAHGLLFRLVFWALRLPLRAVWATALTVLALLGEEVRRWAGLVVSGLLILGAGYATRAFAPPGLREPLVLTLLLLAFIWALAVRRAAYWTAHTNLRSVRQRQWFREMKGEVVEIRGGLSRRLAEATQGTPAGRAFRSNRAAAERAAEAERRQLVAEAEADRAAAAEERERERLADLEPDPYTWERV